MPRGRAKKVTESFQHNRVVDTDYCDRDFKPFIRVDVHCGDITVIRNPTPQVGNFQGCWRFKGNYD